MTQDQNPFGKIKLTRFELVLEAVTVLICAATWGFVVFRVICPDAFPDFFKTPGHIQNTAFVSGMTLFLVLNLYVLRSPHILMRSPTVKITDENKERQYYIRSRCTHICYCLMMVLFFCMTIGRNLHRTKINSDCHNMITCGIIVLALLAGVYYAIRAWMLR